ncbi:hypothetical protein [Micromonospora sp. 15K316]|uniref:hypothetical protein n=1 Tax=Micromonospora sp. 15K316 TaxID=2530376 RepID=UPI001A9D2E74|nr:hypothetical protein [Micromonospora sp. 15K316]
MPDRRAHTPALTTLEPTRRTRTDPGPVTPLNATTSQPWQVRQRLASMSAADLRTYRRWADEVIAERQRQPGVRATVDTLAPVHRAELVDRVVDLLRTNDHLERHETERLAGDLIGRFLREGPAPLPAPPFRRDLDSTFVFDPGAIEVPWANRAQLDAYVRSIAAESARRTAGGLPPLRLHVEVGPGQSTRLVDRLVEQLLPARPGADGTRRGPGRRIADSRAARLTATLRELLARHGGADDAVEFTSRVTTAPLPGAGPLGRGPARDWARIWVGVPAGENGRGGGAGTTARDGRGDQRWDPWTPEEGVSPEPSRARSDSPAGGRRRGRRARQVTARGTTGSRAGAPRTPRATARPTRPGSSRPGGSAQRPADATGSGTSTSPPGSALTSADADGALHAYLAFRANALPALTGEAAPPVTDDLSWATRPGALARPTADVLDRFGLRAVVAQESSLYAAIAATLTHYQLPGGDLLTRQPPDAWPATIAGMILAELRGDDTPGPRIGLDHTDEATVREVTTWIADGMPQDRVPAAILAALNLDEGADGNLQAMLTLTANLIERPIAMVFPNGETILTGPTDQGRGAVLLVATDDGELLATTPRTAAPALLRADADQVLVTQDAGAAGHLPSDVASFSVLHLFLQSVLGDGAEVPLPAPDTAAESLPDALAGTATATGDNLADLLRRTRAAAAAAPTPPAPDPASWNVLPPDSTTVNRLTGFQAARLTEAGVGAVWTAPGSDALFEALLQAAAHGQPGLAGLAGWTAPALRHAFATLLQADLAATGGAAAPLLGLSPQVLGARRDNVLQWITSLTTPGAPLPAQTPGRIARVLAQLLGVRVELVHPDGVQVVPRNRTAALDLTDAPVLRLVVTADGHVMPTVPVPDRHDAIRRPAGVEGDPVDAAPKREAGSPEASGSEPAAATVRPPTPDSIVHTIGIPHRTLPHLDEVVDRIVAAVRARGVQVPENERTVLGPRLLSNYRELVGGGHLVQIGPVEVLVRLDPTDPALAPDPAYAHPGRPPIDDWDAADDGSTGADEKGKGRSVPFDRNKIYHANQATTGGFNTGGTSHTNTGQAGALRAGFGFGMGVGIAPGLLQVVRFGVNVAGTANKVDRSTTNVKDAESGRVEDNRIDSTLVSYTPNWTLRVRTDTSEWTLRGREHTSPTWAETPLEWSSADEHPTGQESLEVWIPDHYLEDGKPQVTAAPPADPRLRAEFEARQRRLPDTYHATGLTGLPELYHQIVDGLRDMGLELAADGPERRELRQTLWKLGINLDAAVNDREEGYPITLHDKHGDVVAQVNVHTSRIPGAVERQGATSAKSHIERVSTAIIAHSGSSALANQSELRVNGELNFVPAPGLVLGPNVGFGWSWTNQDAINAGRTGIWVHVSRYTGRTAGYRASLRHSATLSTTSRPDAEPRPIAGVTGTALLRLPEPDAFAHGFPVDVTSFRQPLPAGTSTVPYAPGLIDDGSTPARELHDAILPHHVARGRGIGMGLAKVDDHVAMRLRQQILAELRRTGYVPHRARHPFAARTKLGTDVHIGHNSRFANLSDVNKFVSSNAFSAYYDQLHQDGFSFTLRGDPKEGRLRQARVTVEAIQDPAELGRRGENNNSAHLQRQTSEYHLVNLSIGGSAGSYSASGSRTLSVGPRFSAGVRLMQTWGIGLEYAYTKGASQTAGRVLNEPQLLEYPGASNEFRLPSRFRARVEYGHWTRRRRPDGAARRFRGGGRTWNSGEVAGTSTVHLIPTINTQRLDTAPTGEPTDPSVMEHAVVYYLDATGLLPAARNLQPTLTGPGRPGDEDVANFVSTVSVRSYLKEILADEYGSENFFKSGFLGHKQGALGVHGELGASAFVGATPDKFVAGLIKLFLNQTSHSRSSGHGIKFSGDDKLKVPLSDVDNLASIAGQSSAWFRFGWNKSTSMSRTGGKEILELSFHRAYAFTSTVDLTVSGVREAHGKFRPTGVDRPDPEHVGPRPMVYLLPEPVALARYGEGRVPVDHDQLMDALRRWRDGNGDPEERLQLSARVVGAVLDRMDREAEGLPADPYREERAALRLLLTDPRHDALSNRLLELGLNSADELNIPDYLEPGGPVNLGHSGIDSLTFHRPAPADPPAPAGAGGSAAPGTTPDTRAPAVVPAPARRTIRPIEILREAIEKAAPGLLGAHRTQWTPNKADRGGLELWYRRVVGEKVVMGQLVGGLDVIDGLFSGTRLQPMSEDLLQLHGVTLLLANRVGPLLADVVEIKLNLTLTSRPEIFDFVDRSGIENYSHAHSGQSEGRSKGVSYGFSPAKTELGGAGNTSNTSGALDANFSGGTSSGVTQSHQSTEEQTVYDWVAHYLARSGVSFDVEVTRLNMPNRPVNNLLTDVYRHMTGRNEPVRRTFDGELVLKLPHSIAEARRLPRSLDEGDLKPLTRLPGDKYIVSARLDDALTVGWDLLGRMFGTEANDATFRSAVTLQPLLSPSHLSNFLHKAVAGRRHKLADDIFLPGHSRTRASLYLVGDLYHLKVLYPIEGSGTGRYAKDQAGTSVSANRSHLRGALVGGVNQGQPLGVNDAAPPTAPAHTHSSSMNTEQSRVAPRGDGIGQTVNYRYEQHLKQQGRLYAVEMRFKGHLEAERTEEGIGSIPNGRFVSDPIVGPVYAQLFGYEVVDLLEQLEGSADPGPASDPSEWPRPDAHTPRHNLDQLFSGALRLGGDHLTVAEEISRYIRGHARTDQVVLSSSVSRQVYERYLVVEEWAIDQLESRDPAAAERLRRQRGEARYQLMWQMAGIASPPPSQIAAVRDRTAALIDLVREHDAGLTPPDGFAAETYDPVLTARLVAHNLRRYVHLTVTLTDGSRVRLRIDPTGHVVRADEPEPA